MNLLVLISAAFLFSLSNAFAPSIIKRSFPHFIGQEPLSASREKNAPTESWSKSAGGGGAASPSRVGVRRRVQKVLQRAKNRTGIQNASELNTKQSASSIVAESASIGGLGWDDARAVDVALDLSNGSNQNKRPEDEFVLASTAIPLNNGATETTEEVDAIRSDVPAAVANTEPLPFVLPKLTEEQKQVLDRGERLQEQTKMGRDGSGYVVVDVKAPEYVVWECLLDFESYTETIPTVRDVTMLTSTHLKSGYHSEKPVMTEGRQQLRHYGTPSLTRAAFTLSKFRLKIAAIHNYRPHPDGHYMDFRLDPDCTNLVLKAAKGVWYTQTNPDGKGEEYTRVWLLCDLKVSRALPSFIVDYAAQRAMPRATTWLKPQVEAAASLWLKNDPPPASPLL
jgi:hypothetical protein